MRRDRLRHDGQQHLRDQPRGLRGTRAVPRAARGRDLRPGLPDDDQRHRPVADFRPRGRTGLGTDRAVDPGAGRVRLAGVDQVHRPGRRRRLQRVLRWSGAHITGHAGVVLDQYHGFECIRRLVPHF